MPKFLLECDVAGVGTLPPSDWRKLAQRCNEAIDLLAGRAQWLHSYVTDNTLISVYIADERASLAEHAQAFGLPDARICEIRTTIDPATAEDPS